MCSKVNRPHTVSLVSSADVFIIKKTEYDKPKIVHLNNIYVWVPQTCDYKIPSAVSSIFPDMILL